MSKQFKELSKKSVFDNEQDILKKWKEEDILNKTIKNRDNKKKTGYFMMDLQLLMVSQVFIIW